VQRDRYAVVRDGFPDQLGHIRGAMQIGDLGDVGPPRLPGRRPGRRTPLVDALARLGFPVRDTPGGLPRGDRVGARLGHQFDREFGTIRFGQCLHDRHRRRHGRGDHAVEHLQIQAIPPGGHDLGFGEQSRTVGERDRLADPDAAHGRGVPSLGTVEHRDRADRRYLVEIENRCGHGVFSDR
jgi:hypothetical protein